MTSLYTNILHNEGIAACTEALSNRDIQEPPTEHLGTLISFILRKNSFVFGKKHYPQINGTAMGTRMAPSYANLFMAQLDESFLERSTCRRPFVWWRYIDDIFLIWHHGEDTLSTFIEDLNSFHQSIQFTAEWSSHSITFLDTHVFLTDGVLSFTPSQPTHTSTCHLVVVIHAIVNQRYHTARLSEFAGFVHQRRILSDMPTNYNPTSSIGGIIALSYINRLFVLVPFAG